MMSADRIVGHKIFVMLEQHNSQMVVDAMSQILRKNHDMGVALEVCSDFDIKMAIENACTALQETQGSQDDQTTYGSHLKLLEVVRQEKIQFCGIDLSMSQEEEIVSELQESALKSGIDDYQLVRSALGLINYRNRVMQDNIIKFCVVCDKPIIVSVGLSHFRLIDLLRKSGADVQAFYNTVEMQKNTPGDSDVAVWTSGIYQHVRDNVSRFVSEKFQKILLKEMSCKQDVLSVVLYKDRYQTLKNVGVCVVKKPEEVVQSVLKYSQGTTKYITDDKILTNLQSEFINLKSQDGKVSYGNDKGGDLKLMELKLMELKLMEGNGNNTQFQHNMCKVEQVGDKVQ